MLNTDARHLNERIVNASEMKSISFVQLPMGINITYKWRLKQLNAENLGYLLVSSGLISEIGHWHSFYESLVLSILLIMILVWKKSIETTNIESE